MKLSLDDLRSLIFGACEFLEIDKYLAAYRFLKEQREYLKPNAFYYDRTKFSSSITIEFETNALNFGFAYKLQNYSLQALNTIFLFSGNFKIFLMVKIKLKFVIKSRGV